MTASAEILEKKAGASKAAKKVLELIGDGAIGLVNRIGDKPHQMYTGLGAIGGGIHAYDEGNNVVDGSLKGALLGSVLGLGRIKDFAHLAELKTVYEATRDAEKLRRLGVLPGAIDKANLRSLDTVSRIGKALSRRTGSPVHLASMAAGGIGGGVVADQNDKSPLVGMLVGAKLGSIAGLLRPSDPFKLLAAGAGTVADVGGPTLKQLLDITRGVH